MIRMAGSVEELLSGATSRETIDAGDGKSGALIERVTIDGVSYIVKHLSLEHDWTMRAVGELTSAVVRVSRQGLFDRMPECINQPIVAMVVSPTRSRFGPSIATETTLLMRDVGQWLVRESAAPISVDDNLRFVDHMAAVHAEFWGGGPEIEVVPLMHRYLELSPLTAATEAQIGSTNPIPPLIRRGWDLLVDLAPAASSVVTGLASDPSPLVTALQTTPQTFVHGDWKLGNLGIDSSGRTILLDWALPGRAPGCSDLAWYLAVNCRRLPVTKEATIAAYREALERLGVGTEPWWDTQLSLCLLGALVQFGWEKALGGYDDELKWWEQQAVAGSRLLA